jgi:hypothetical protein
MPNYANIVQSTQTGTNGGYKPALYFAPAADIATWGRPLATPVALGDKKKITTAHVFGTGKAAILWDAKLNSVTHKSKSVGDEGAQELEHSAELVFLGDNAPTLEQVENLMNDQPVAWIKDSDCQNNDSYVQLGDDCVPVTVSVEFDGKTTKEGKKEYKITLTSKRKFFYLAALDITP